MGWIYFSSPYFYPLFHGGKSYNNNRNIKLKGKFAMRKIINKKMYDTETAEWVEEFENTPYKSNYHYYVETLYRKKTGEFFLHGCGNAASPYADENADRMRSPGEKIIPLTEAEAKNWVERYGDVDTYIELFGEVEE